MSTRLFAIKNGWGRKAENPVPETADWCEPILIVGPSTKIDFTHTFCSTHVVKSLWSILPLTILSFAFLAGCATPANQRVLYSPDRPQGPWTNELKQFDQDNPDWRDETPLIQTWGPRDNQNTKPIWFKRESRRD